VRRELGLRRVDALALERIDGQVVTLRRGDGGRLRATVARHDDGRPRPISCGDEPEAVPAYELVELA
jgi:hypothetical protein